MMITIGRAIDSFIARYAMMIPTRIHSFWIDVFFYQKNWTILTWTTNILTNFDPTQKYL